MHSRRQPQRERDGGQPQCHGRRRNSIRAQLRRLRQRFRQRPRKRMGRIVRCRRRRRERRVHQARFPDRSGRSFRRAARRAGRRDDREPRSTRRVSGLRLGRHRGDRLLLGRHEPERAAMGWSIQVTLAGEREPGRKYQPESLQPGCVQRGRSRPSRRDERNKQLRGCVGFRGRTRLRSGVGTGHHRPRDICARVRRVFLAVPNS